MKISLEKLLGYSKVVNDFYKEKLPLSCTYKLTKINSIVEKELEFYKNEMSKIIQEFAQKDENGNVKMTEDQTQVLLDTEKTTECSNRIKALNEMEVDVECEKYLLNINEFGTEKQISIEELQALIPFFE